MTPRLGDRWRGVILVGLFLGALAGTAAAQEEPVVFTSRPSSNWFSLRDIHGSVELEALRQSSSHSSGGASSQSTDTLFQETLGLHAGGAIVHPNLVDLSLAGWFGLNQESFTTDGQSDSSMGTLLEYDVSATILRKEFAPFTLYSNRHISESLQPFVGILHNTSAMTGASMDLRSEKLPTHFNLYTSEQTQTSPGGIDDFRLQQDVFEWQTQARITDRQTLNWDYHASAIHEGSGTGSSDTTNYNVQDATLSHDWSFGPGAQSSLSSLLHAYDQGGDLPLRELNWDEFLRLQHSPNFQTHYRAGIDQQQSGPSDQTTGRLEAGFSHQLYESLTTTGSLGYIRQTQSEGGQSDDVLADLDWEYRKCIPYGLLTAMLGGGVDRQNSTTGGSITTVRRHPATFRDPLPIVLTGERVIPASIVLTDTQGLIVYLEGVHYTVHVLSNRIEIRRRALADGTEVLLNYDVAATPDRQVDTNQLRFGLRYDIDKGALKGLSLFGRQVNQDQTISPLTEGFLSPNVFTDSTVGAEYRFRELTLRLEHEQYDSTVQPFNATRLGADWLHDFTQHSTFTVSANRTYIDYMEEGNQVVFTDLSGHWVQHLTPRLDAVLGLSWRRPGRERRTQLARRGRQRGAAVEVPADLGVHVVAEFRLGRRYRPGQLPVAATRHSKGVLTCTAHLQSATG